MVHQLLIGSRNQSPPIYGGANGQHLYGCLVIFNTSSPHHGAKTHSLLIRDGEVISASSFED
jgi:hypothetical protein